jgi:hypothetical protein
VATCRSCGAEIRWVTLAKGAKKHPVDRQPRCAFERGPRSLLGAIAVPADINKAFVISQYTTISELQETIVYRSHFASCPDADKHRKAAA